jgi:hypothetical protein
MVANDMLSSIIDFMSSFDKHKRKKYIKNFIDRRIRFYINEYIIHRKSLNEQYKHTCTIRQRMSHVLKDKSSNEYFNKLFGCDLDKFVVDLKCNNKLMIDYIIPRELFKFNIDSEIEACFSYKNLMTLPIADEQKDLVLYDLRFDAFKHILPSTVATRIGNAISESPNRVLKIKKLYPWDGFDELYPMNELLLECDDIDIGKLLDCVKKDLENDLAKVKVK